MYFKFNSTQDPFTQQPINLEFDATAFRRVEGEAASKALFKMAAHEAIKTSSDVEPISVKYQVLCKKTAMIGVVKQKEKVTGELKEFEQTFSKAVKRPVQPKPQS